VAIPIIYNVRSVRARWVSAIVAVLGIAGTVSVFVAMLALAHGFKTTLVSSGSIDNAIIRRAGASGEIDGSVGLDQVKVIQDAPGVAHKGSQPLVSPEVVVLAAFPLKSTGTDANVQVRGVSPVVQEVRTNVKITEGRLFQAGRNELIVGKYSAQSYAGLGLGDTVKFGGGTWNVVGIFDAGGSAFDSEVWCDGTVLAQTYDRPTNLFQSVTLRMTSPDAFQALKDSLTSDPRLTVQVDREREYYDRQSQMLTTLITVLGFLVAGVMGVGAVFGALNTMYSMISERSREIATMRAIGFGSMNVTISFIFEALLVALIGGIAGCLLVLPINGWTVGTLNWQTFSHVAFAFSITPALIGGGLVFALLMGLVGGAPPAVRAATRPVAGALREL
jgi:putative ABC transport system permease protein